MSASKFNFMLQNCHLREMIYNHPTNKKLDLLYSQNKSNTEIFSMESRISNEVYKLAFDVLPLNLVYMTSFDTLINFP